MNIQFYLFLLAWIPCIQFWGFCLTTSIIEDIDRIRETKHKTSP